MSFAPVATYRRLATLAVLQEILAIFGNIFEGIWIFLHEGKWQRWPQLFVTYIIYNLVLTGEWCVKSSHSTRIQGVQQHWPLLSSRVSDTCTA